MLLLNTNGLRSKNQVLSIQICTQNTFYGIMQNSKTIK